MAEPIDFPAANTVFAKDQPEYLPLPAHVADDGTVTSCWRLSPEELAEVQRTGCVFVGQLTFGQALQPQFVAAVPPEGTPRTN